MNANLFLGLAQSSLLRRGFALITAAAGKRNLSFVRFNRIRAAREKEMPLVIMPDEGYQHRCTLESRFFGQLNFREAIGGWIVFNRIL
jgi:hypothetical protein